MTQRGEMGLQQILLLVNPSYFFGYKKGETPFRPSVLRVVIIDNYILIASAASTKSKSKLSATLLQVTTPL
jgi:hypothetical protein